MPWRGHPLSASALVLYVLASEILATRSPSLRAQQQILLMLNTKRVDQCNSYGKTIISPSRIIWILFEKIGISQAVRSGGDHNIGTNVNFTYASTT